MLEYKDKYIEVAYGNYVTEEQKGQVQIKICNDNGDNFIAIFHNVILAPDIYNRLFSIITFMDLLHNCLLHKWFCTVYFGDKEKNTATLPNSAQTKHAFLG